jgi:PD-(D/E)XK nuclease superfamily
MLETRYSMVKAYRRCPKSADYKYNQNLQRKKPAPPLLRGTILHAMLDARISGKSGTKKALAILDEYEQKYRALFREEQELYGESFIADIRRVYEGYERTYGTLAEDELEYEASEELVSTNLTPDIRYTGHLDKRVITKRDGRRWILDHKTHRVIPTEEQRFQDYQILMYIWAWNRENPNDQIDGVMWDYIRTKPPRIPEALKSGELSQAKNIDTDWYTYTKELTRLRLDPKPYQQFLKDLKGRSGDRFYLRVKLPAPSKVMVEQVVKDFRETSIIMNGLDVYPRTMTRDCSWCEFYRLCNAELRGLDAAFIQKTEYEECPQSEDNSEEE